MQLFSVTSQLCCCSYHVSRGKTFKISSHTRTLFAKEQATKWLCLWEIKHFEYFHIYEGGSLTIHQHFGAHYLHGIISSKWEASRNLPG